MRESLTELGQLTAPEISNVGRWMRHYQIAFVRGLSLEANYVEVQCSWSPTNVPCSTRGLLDALQLHQELAWRKLCLQRDHLVEIHALINWPERLGFLYGRFGDHSGMGDARERPTGVREMGVSVAEVGAKRNKCEVGRHPMIAFRARA